MCSESKALCPCSTRDPQGINLKSVAPDLMNSLANVITQTLSSETQENMASYDQQALQLSLKTQTLNFTAQGFLVSGLMGLSEAPFPLRACHKGPLAPSLRKCPVLGASETIPPETHADLCFLFANPVNQGCFQLPFPYQMFPSKVRIILKDFSPVLPITCRLILRKHS